MNSGLFARHPLWRSVESAWELARLDRRESAAAGWIPASVPGAVQVDWARAHALFPGPFIRRRTSGPMTDSRTFTDFYRTRVPDVAMAKGEHLFFMCGGVDFMRARSASARKVVLCHEGMFSPFEVPLAGCPAGTELDVLILPAPKRRGARRIAPEASDSCKPAVSYGWDWHPRLTSRLASRAARGSVFARRPMCAMWISATN